jgi:hypothetical protein
MKRVLYLTPFIAIALMVCSCGLGSESTSRGGGTRVRGVAAKGPISGATVQVYALGPDGSVGEGLGITNTATDGSYYLDLGKYAGNVLVNVSGGSYTDEASGSVVDNPDTFRAAVVNISGYTAISITPYTEIAVLHAGSYAAANITSANNRVTNMLGIDIIVTVPSDTLDPGSASDSVDSIEYGLASAAISQAVEAGDYASVSSAMDTIVEDLEDQMLDETASTLINSVAECECISSTTLAALNDVLASAIETTQMASLADIEIDDAIAVAESDLISDVVDVSPDEAILPDPQPAQ